MSEYKIEKNVPVPSIGTRGQANSIYPFAAMEPGDSIHVETNGKGVGRVQSTAHKFAKYHDRKFTTRRTNTGIRVWRIE